MSKPQVWLSMNTTQKPWAYVMWFRKPVWDRVKHCWREGQRWRKPMWQHSVYFTLPTLPPMLSSLWPKNQQELQCVLIGPKEKAE